MKSIQGWLYFLLGLALVVAAAAGALWVLRAIASWIATQNSQVGAAYIAFGGTVLAGIGAVVVSQQRTKSREIAEAHRPTKVQLYRTFVQQMVGILHKGKEGTLEDPAVQKELEDFFYDFTSGVMLWGSPAVLTAYGAFRKADDPNATLLLMDDLLQAMRKDLGLSNWNVQRGDLLKLLLTDPEYLDAVLAGKTPGT